MLDPYWAKVGLQVEAAERLKWAYRHRVATRDREFHERAVANLRKARLAKKRAARAAARKKSA